MKKILILTGALTVLTAGLAAAASSGVVNLSWDDCGTFGVANKTFACDTNAGTHTLVASFISYVPLDSMNGNEVILEYQTSGSTMSPWWQIKTPTDNSAACRRTALTADFDFTGGPGHCFDFWNGQAAGGVGIIRNLTQVNRARILTVCAVALELAGPVDAGTETYSARLTVTNLKTIGPDACTGCGDGALFVVQYIKCTQNPNGSHDKTMETTGTFAQFQAGIPGAPGPTSTRNTTWGAVKSLYH